MSPRDDLEDVLGSVEGPALEFKREISHRDVLGRAVCAFANDLAGLGGGDLIIGVSDDGRRHPVDTTDRALQSIAQVRDEGNILPLPSIVVQAAQFRGHPVVWVHVNASDFAPVRFRGVAWVRPGPMTKQASSDDERVLTERARSKSVPPDLRAVDGTSLTDLDSELIRSTLVPAQIAPEIIEENDRPFEIQLASLGLLSRSGTPSMLGVLLASFDPTAHVPGAYVQFVRYDGSDESAAVSDDDEIRDNLVIAGRKISDLLQVNIRHRLTTHNGLQEISKPDYPLGALRETLVNALVHRSYEGTNAPTRILWFTDRLEVHSPGGPFGVVTAENFRRTTDYRNPNLAAAMKSLGYLNRFGRGIARTEAEMRRNGNPAPEFEIGQSWWTVILRSVP